MLYYWLYPLHEKLHVLNVFRYITFRSVYAAITAFLICLLLGGWLIKVLRNAKFSQPIRSDGPQAHQGKQGTPTMGGLLIVMAVIFSSALWGKLQNPMLLLVCFAMVWFGGVGFVDDLLKLIFKGSKGLRAWQKIVLQTVGSVIVVLLYLNFLPADYPYSTSVIFPFVKEPVRLEWTYFAFTTLVLVGASNAVNLTDGLDGLAIGSSLLSTLAFTVITYLVGNVKYSQYLHILYVPNSSELTVFCAALAGASLGFLWFNTYPAQVFMGDTGSLALGGALGTVAVIVKQEALLVIVGGIFVLEALSVILQVTSFKLRKKRIFRMAPLHHHFELGGLSEPKVIVRFWIMAIILSLLTLSTLKLR